MSARAIDILPSADDDAVSLPAWIYPDPRVLRAGEASSFPQSWQVVCHVNDVPRAGDYHAFDFLGEGVIVLRGEDGRCAASTTSAATAPRGCSTAPRELRPAHRLPLPRLELRARRAPGRRCRAAAGSKGSTRERQAWCRWSRRSAGLRLRAASRPACRASREMAAPYRRRDRGLSASRNWCRRAGWPAAARGELEERRRQLLRRPAHPRRPPGPDAPVRRQLRRRGAALGRQDVGRACATPSSNWSERALPGAAAAGSASAAGAAAAAGTTTSSGPTWPSTSIRTRSTSCSGSRSRPPRP